MNTSINYATFIISPGNHKRNSNRHKRMYKDDNIRHINNEAYKQNIRDIEVKKR